MCEKELQQISAAAPKARHLYQFLCRIICRLEDIFRDIFDGLVCNDAGDIIALCAEGAEPGAAGGNSLLDSTVCEGL